MALEERWNIERKMFQLPDTPALRQAFYAGARTVLKEVVDAIQEKSLIDEIERDLLRLNDELHAFCCA